ncbi:MULTISPECIES: LysR family transcriptional regulator [unclassified Mesorhizobium]|uniref:LysR family transcriptional regulator n=1 Tax=unclassified Mesorhizobium TaxID=325217 RepID=UPI000F75AF91|nr:MULTISPECIES: LysR family transcriptional regulator [unclassified Mesorhizobium]AZO69025.1 LysR family transcriptional regulator [Mesorhizobium sp. M6A.T.Cr.TU.016.01.1.1]RUU18724.1 LysR family transcriptional regulator [Mesorhizobium sp. M6A.T.Ca.TU.002.02.2.1]RWP56211.1 MAG: LysR family transcriptional regulator [Mesorhizobium sp.]
MNLNRLAYFAAVVDAGSFTRAAERLGITKAVVSQQVARLERDVGTTLLIRTTRRVHPTEAGRTFHARCLQVLQQAEDAFDELAQAAAEPTGTLRIAAPNDYGTSAVVPVVAAFSARYPACRVELTLGDETIDLASGGMDVAIRVGWLADSSLQARRIGTFRQFMVCGAEFAGRFTAGEPQDLAGLPFVANLALREPLLWQFSRGDDEHEAVRMQATIAIDATPAVLAAVRAGAGLSVLPDFLVRDELAAGRLVQILPEWRLPSGGIYTVYPAARFRPPKVTRFVEMLVAAEQRTGSVAEGSAL